jgi:hypothetical protein
MAKQNNGSNAAQGAELLVSNKGKGAQLLNGCKNCPIGPVKLVGYNDKSETTGVWAKVQFEGTKEVAFIESGHLAALHNEGSVRLFSEPKVEPGKIAHFLPDAQLGIEDGKLTF